MDSFDEEDAEDYEEERQSDEIAELDLEIYDGPTWDLAAFEKDFEVIDYAAPFVVVIRRSDQLKGTLEYLSWPRTYFGWTPAA